MPASEELSKTASAFTFSFPRTHMPKPNYPAFDSQGSCSWLDFHIMQFESPVVWKALWELWNMSFSILTTSKESEGNWRYKGLSVAGETQKWNSWGPFGVCCFGHPSCLPVIAAQFSFGYCPPPQGIGWYNPAHQPDLGPVTYSTFWPLRCFRDKNATQAPPTNLLQT